MKRFLLGLFVTLSATAAMAQTTQFKNNLGHPQGKAVTKGNMTRFYNNQGHPQGKAVTKGKTTYFYNNQGHPQGKAVTKSGSKPR